MYNKSTTYSKAQTDEWRGRIAIDLLELNEWVTIPDIQQYDIRLAGISSQKMSRMLNELVEYGLAIKLKGSKRMMYKGVGERQEPTIKNTESVEDYFSQI